MKEIHCGARLMQHEAATLHTFTVGAIFNVGKPRINHA